MDLGLKKGVKLENFEEEFMETGWPDTHTHTHTQWKYIKKTNGCS